MCTKLAPFRHVLAPSAAVLPKRIEDEHVMPPREVRVGDMGADEAGAAGDDDSHGKSFTSAFLETLGVDSSELALSSGPDGRPRKHSPFLTHDSYVTP